MWVPFRLSLANMLVMAEESQQLRPERRREKRESSSGQVIMIFEDTHARVTGTLMDVSPGGFRIQHEYAEVSLNQIARIQYSEGEKRARVVWNRRAGSEIQSGFMNID